MKAFYLLLSLILVSFSAHTKDLPKDLKLEICGDGAEWPPYHYSERDKDMKLTGKVTGFSVDLLNEIFKKHNIEVKYSLPTWKHCWKQTIDGEKYQIALDGSYSEFRDKKFHLTSSHYAVTPKLFYSKDVYPKGFPSFKTVREMFRVGKICGLYGYNYNGFAKGIKNKKIERLIANFKKLIPFVRDGHCKGLLARYEPFVGFKKLGQDLIKLGNLSYVEIPGASDDKFYIMVSRKYQYGSQLKDLINKGIKELKNSGKYDELLKKYGIK